MYDIVQKGDTLFFATQGQGLFKFDIARPQRVISAGRKGKLPFRGIGFDEEGNGYTCSYRTGVHRIGHDSLTMLPGAYVYAWDMKSGPGGKIWLAGDRGVFFMQGDSAILFAKTRGAHDIEFVDSTLFVAHLAGISQYDMETGRRVKEHLPGRNFWCARATGKTVFFGGKRAVAVFSAGEVRCVELDDPDNIVWDLVGGRAGLLYAATQKGLVEIDLSSGKQSTIGYAGKCVKSIYRDSRGTLWVGRFY